MSKQYYRTLENWVAKLFLEAEYTVEQNVRFAATKTEVDIIAKKKMLNIVLK
ncbi:MAG: hypothetical protein IKL72_06395 [Firmicutes bacterium]|nr:hypothetical protein [Bacillota bacterium]